MLLRVLRRSLIVIVTIRCLAFHANEALCQSTDTVSGTYFGIIYPNAAVPSRRSVARTPGLIGRGQE